MALSQQERDALKMAGMGDAAINLYETGKATGPLLQRIQLVLKGVTGRSGTPSASAPAQQTPVFGRSVPNPTKPGTALAANVPAQRAATPAIKPTGLPRAGAAVSGPVYGPTIEEANAWGASHPGTPSAAANSGPVPFQYTPEINQYGMPSLPDPFNFNIPQVHMPDYAKYTSDAKQMAADAFAPYLAAFDIARTNAQAQGKTSKEATAGLYANFVKDIASKAAETAGRYDQVKADTAQRTTQNQADIQENANSNEANIGNQLASLGLGVSVPGALQQDAAQTNTAQQEAGKAGEAQQQFYDSEKLAQGNYDTRFGELGQKSGIEAQTGIDSQLANILSGIDINKANAQGEQGTTALDIAQKLAAQDMQAQQANAGYSLQGQGMQYQAGQDAFTNALGLNTTREGQIQQDYQNAFNLWNAQTGFGIDQAKLAGSSATPFSLSDYPDKTKTYGYLVNQLGDPNKAGKVYKDMSSILSQFMQTPEYINTKDSVQAGRLKFAQFARDFLATNGIPEGVGESAAMSYYTEQMS